MYAYNLNSSNLEPTASAKDDPDEEEITRTQRKGGKPGQCLLLLLVIFAIIASKSVPSLNLLIFQ